MYRTRLGHTHLFVRDLQRSVAFYTRYLNLRVTEQVGDKYAFLTSGELHHEFAVTALGEDASTPDRKSVGLMHVAFDVPDKRSFALAYQKLSDDGIKVTPVDHRIGWGAYFRDPDGNGLEIYCDTRQEPDGAPLWRGEDRTLSHEKIMAVLQS